MLSWVLFAVAVVGAISALVLIDRWWTTRHDDNEELPEGWPGHPRDHEDLNYTEEDPEPDELGQKYDKFPMPRRAGELGKVDDPPF